MTKPKQQQQRIEDWQDVVKTEQGRRVINEIINYSGFLQTPAIGQTNQAMKNIGMQSVGQYVFQTIRDNSPDDFIKLMKENSNG